MEKGNIMGYIDVAQVTLYVFWAFFAGLIFYLRREDRREGYPLLSEPTNTSKNPGLIWIPPPKDFRLPHGGTVSAPNGIVDDRPLKAAKVTAWPGAPLTPTCDPMLAEVGPGSYAMRADTPDQMHHGGPRIIPMRLAAGFSIADGDPDPRGMTVVAADRKVAGIVRDVWVDRMEVILRYLEVELPAGEGEAGGAAVRVLLPITFSSIDRRRGQVDVDAIMARHFASVPRLANPNQVTLLEEDKICAFYGAGTLYAHPSRTEPLL